MGTDAVPPSRRERWSIASITAAFALLLMIWALVTPMFQAPDELPHTDAAIAVASGTGWPAPGDLRASNAIQAAKAEAPTVPPSQRTTWAQMLRDHPGTSDGVNQMTQHPPTYYALAAGVLHLVHYEDLRWDLVVMTLRLLDVVLVAPLPLLVWASARRLTRSPRVALVAATAVFAVPQLAQIASSVTNDAPVILLGALVTWLVVRVLTGDRSWRTVIGTGLALGALVAMKATGFPAIPFVAVGMLVAPAGQMRLRGRVLRGRVLRTLVALAIGAAASGWWWVRNLVVFHTLQPNGLARAWTASPWPDGDTGPDPGYFLGSEWDSLTTSFWGKFGLLAYPLDGMVVLVLTVVALVAVLAALLLRSQYRQPSAVLLVFPVVAGLLLLANNWASYERLHRITGSQGRYFFVALGALVLVAALGSLRFLPVPARRVGGRIVAVGAPVMALYGLSVAYRGFYEGFALDVTRAGLARLADTAPLGGTTLGVLAVLLAVVGGVAVVRVWLACGPVRGLPGADAPAHQEGRRPDVASG